MSLPVAASASVFANHWGTPPLRPGGVNSRQGGAPPVSEYALGGRHASHARVGLDGLAEGAGGGLEGALDDVVGVAAVVADDVQGEGAAGGGGAPELLGQAGAEGAEQLRRYLRLPD